MEQEIRALIDRIRGNLGAVTLDEASTKQTLILPLLRRLGWDVENVEEVRPEYPVENGRVDYGLCVKGQCAFFIEAKKPSEELERHEEQLLQYSFRHGVELAALTNGSTWFFYLPMRRGDWSARRFYAIDIAQQQPEDVTKNFCLILAKESVANGRSLAYAQQVYERRSRQTAVKDALPKAWNKVVAEPDPLLVELLLDTTERMCGQRPNETEISAFLEANRAQLVMGLSRAAEGTGRTTSEQSDRPQLMVRLSTREFRGLVVEILKTMGGKGRKPDVEDEAYRRKAPVFSQPHYQKSVGEGIPAWKKQLQWARHALCKLGMLEKPIDVGDGVWQLTAKGWNYNWTRQTGQ